MSLDDVSTKELRAELARREEVDREARYAQIRAQYPCPVCGGDPVQLNNEMIAEHVQAPRDPDGRPMLYMPYEAGEVIGGTWELTVTCENGHETRTTTEKFFDRPMGSPRLHRGAR